ncbi:hypothetical protein MKEN_00032500 [Mycena kentingensis (nom. inval.)]|nr:hypothetical protein MKEN_00032500 [Mycena kentingensis (nom. inval.)]
MSFRRSVANKRSFTGNHSLLPATGPAVSPFMPKVPTYTFLKWTFGRGSVIWKIWPAVILHSCIAGVLVYLHDFAGYKLELSNTMLTVMGVVIGFVISYRAGSGYDRYWMGRSAWSDVIRNSRTVSRLIWFHVPPRLSPGALQRSPQEHAKVMAEKRMALDLVEAYAVALKHHLRGEVGIYFEDLYDLIRPLHDFEDPTGQRPTVASAVPPPPAPTAPPAPPQSPPSEPATPAAIASSSNLKPNKLTKRPANTSQHSIHQPLQPAQNHIRIAETDAVLARVNPSIVPFAGVFTSIANWFRSFWKANEQDIEGHRTRDRSSRMRTWSGPVHPHAIAQLEEVQKGENLPVEILRCLSEWVSVLEERQTVPGASIGSILAGIQTFEQTLTTLEHILTTPLPFVYSVHIRHVVWLYLFLLPLQLVTMFGWQTVPAVAVAAFVYLGFVAAGEEIEQPFGYDDNDLDLDMFCRDIIRQDVQSLKEARCLNAWFPPVTNIVAPANGGGDPGKLSAETALGIPVEEMYAHGGNMYRASLASLSDSVSVSETGDRDSDSDEVDTATRGECGDAE